MSPSSLADTVTIPCPSTLVAPVLAIIESLKNLQFGQLTVVVHDAHVVQIDRTERHRLNQRQPSAAT